MSLVLIDAKDTTRKNMTSLGKILIRGNSILTVSLPDIPYVPILKDDGKVSE